MPVEADEAAANTCASSLDHEARLVLDTVMAAPQPTEPLRKVLAVNIGGRVADGELSIFRPVQRPLPRVSAFGLPKGLYG